MTETETMNMNLTIEDFTSDPNEHDQGKKSWLDNIIAAKLKAEHEEALPLRASVLVNLEKIQTQVMSFF